MRFSITDLERGSNVGQGFDLNRKVFWNIYVPRSFPPWSMHLPLRLLSFVCVCVCVCVCARACVRVCKLRKLLFVYYVTFVFSITVL